MFSGFMSRWVICFACAAAAGLDQDVEQPIDAHRLGDHVVERGSVEELHAHVDPAVGELAEVLDRDDVAVADRRRRPRLLAEPGHRLGVGDDLRAQQLDRKPLLDVNVLGGEDLAHAASPILRGSAGGGPIAARIRQTNESGFVPGRRPRMLVWTNQTLMWPAIITRYLNRAGLRATARRSRRPTVPEIWYLCDRSGPSRT
jgi:hypothetical protein